MTRPGSVANSTTFAAAGFTGSLFTDMSMGSKTRAKLYRTQETEYKKEDTFSDRHGLQRFAWTLQFACAKFEGCAYAFLHCAGAGQLPRHAGSHHT